MEDNKNELEKLYYDVLKKIAETNEVSSAQLIIINLYKSSNKPNSLDSLLNGGVKIANTIDKIIGGSK